ncbi:hypothetical protein [Kineococcus radiotolerans]|uniref:hypothetical protein n=1 Tax=Kineococcus radiotolerans TaxID=131568 RepID=UPI00003A3EF9|nr:hypothetical protein [Kineococcus radiotolerans]
MESKVIEEALKVPLFRVLRSSWIGMSVLAVPGTQSDYLSGARKQTLRRKIRAAQRDGVTYRRIEDPVERRELLALADRVEMEHSDPNYRNSRPQNAGILGHRFWLGGFGPSGEPLLLAVLPIANGAAYLRYFRTLGHGNTFSNARYMLSAAMVEELRKEGVSFVFDGTPPSYLPNGLRDFQRMVGFRAMRVRLVRRSARPASGAVRQVPRAGAFAVSRQEQQEGELIQ